MCCGDYIGSRRLGIMYITWSCMMLILDDKNEGVSLDLLNITPRVLCDVRIY